MRVKPNYSIKLQLSPFPDDVDKGHAGWWMMEFKSKLVQRTQLLIMREEKGALTSPDPESMAK